MYYQVYNKQTKLGRLVRPYLIISKKQSKSDLFHFGMMQCYRAIMLYATYFRSGFCFYLIMGRKVGQIQLSHLHNMRHLHFIGIWIFWELAKLHLSLSCYRPCNINESFVPTKWYTSYCTDWKIPTICQTMRLPMINIVCLCSFKKPTYWYAIWAVHDDSFTWFHSLNYMK